MPYDADNNIKELALKISINSPYESEVIEKILRDTIKNKLADDLEEIQYKSSFWSKIQDLGLFSGVVAGVIASILSAILM